MLMVLPLALSACMEPSHPAAPTPTTPDLGGPSAEPAPPVAPAQPNLTLPSLAGLRLEACDGVSLRLDVPEDRVSAFLPAGFEAVKSSGLAQVFVFAQRCPRLVLPDSVAQDVGLLWTVARVEPVDRSWVGSGISLYPLEVLVTDNGTARELAARGPAARAGAFASDETALPGGGARHEWAFAAGEESVRISFQVPVHSTEAAIVITDYYLWSGNGTLRRLDVDEQMRPHVPMVGADGATLEFSGDGTLHGLVGLDRFAAVATPLWDWTWDLPRAPLTFAGPETQPRGNPT